MLQRKIPDCYNKFLIELGPKHKIASFRGILSDHEALKRIRKIREGHNSTTYIDISILVPICAKCKNCADSKFGNYELPEILIPNWLSQYHNLGIDKDILPLIERELRVNNWKGLFCFKCSKQIAFTVNGEKFYVFSTPLTDYYGCQKSPGRTSVDWMKNLIFEEYGNKCNSCEQIFEVEDLTIDHIFPSDSGGKAEFLNLQPLCQSCNNEKSNIIPKIIISHITAELLPPEVDCKLRTAQKRIEFLCENRSHPLAQYFYQMD
jgi:5-methylcytosine-specific restriction endonuclease McrA